MTIVSNSTARRGRGVLPVLAIAALLVLPACNTPKGETTNTPGSPVPAPNGQTPAAGTKTATAPAVKTNVGTVRSVQPAQEDDAPNIVWKGSDGKEHSLSEYRGKVVMINFWGTWCPPCRRELPAIVQLRKELGPDKFEVIGINIGERQQAGMTLEQSVAAFAANFGLEYPLVIGNEETSEAYGGIGVVPTTFIVDKNGKIVQKIEGMRDLDGFRSMVNAYM